MVVTDEVLAITIVIEEFKADVFYSKCGSGHESAGEVVEVGEGVTQWKKGLHSEPWLTRRRPLTSFNR